MVTQSKVGTFKPKVYTAVKHPLPITFGPIEPSSVTQALRDPAWKTAMDAEYSAQMHNKTSI